MTTHADDLMGAEEARRILDACDPTTPEGCQLASACRTVIALREILEGSTEAPTLTEIAAHGGEWRWIVATPHGLAGGRVSGARWITESAPSCARWWPLDVHGVPCAWPRVAGTTRGGDGR